MAALFVVLVRGTCQEGELAGSVSNRHLRGSSVADCGGPSVWQRQGERSPSLPGKGSHMRPPLFFVFPQQKDQKIPLTWPPLPCAKGLGHLACGEALCLCGEPFVANR